MAIENPYVGMKVVPSDELRSSVKKWASSGWYSPKVVDMIASIINCFDENGKPYTVTNVTGAMNIQINFTGAKTLIFNPIFFDEYIGLICIDYKRVNELI